MINRKALKQKFRDRTPVLGGWTSIGHPQITEIIAQAGFDFIGIDIEHSTITLEQSQRIIAASQAAGVCCLPRIASHNMEMIKRLLDSGADGIIVPSVAKPEELENLIQWMKYPPQGIRSFGIARAQNYGFDFDQYVKSWNEDSILVIQIESIEAVNNIEKLLAYNEVDGIMIGPYDLSGSLGLPGQLDHPKVLEACNKVLQACQKRGMALGNQLVEPDLASVKKRLSDGYSFIVMASDIFVLWKWSARMRELKQGLDQ